MPVKKNNQKNLKDFDFDTIFDEEKPKSPKKLPTTLFESFGHTDEFTVKANEKEPVDFFQQNNSKIPTNINSLPSSAKHIIKNKNEFRSNNNQMMTRNSLAANNFRFNDFDFKPNQSLKKKNNGNFFDMESDYVNRNKVSEKNIQSSQNQNDDIDLMGLNVDKDILNQDIKNLDEKLFTKDNKVVDQQFVVNQQKDNLFIKKENENDKFPSSFKDYSQGSNTLNVFIIILR